MQAAELIVELVLTGMLMLVVLFLPALAVDEPLVFGADQLMAADRFAWAIAIGFVLGVVVDRCADSILSRWEAIGRCQLAWRRGLRGQREKLVGGAPIRDPFPEDWMRVHVMGLGEDGTTRWMEQLRIRIRIARTVAVLVPALTTSALLGLWASAIPPALRDYAIALPTIHLVYLGVAYWLSERERWTPPRTDAYKQSGPCAEQAWRMRLASAMTVWLTLELATALVVFVVLANDGGKMLSATAILLVGLAMTSIAIQTWARIQGTFMGFLWNVCRFRSPEKLKEACL